MTNALESYSGAGARLVLDVVREPGEARGPKVFDNPRACAQEFRRLQDVGTLSKSRENFAVMMLDCARRVIAWHQVSLGTMDATSAHPREVFRAAIAAGAHAIVVAHNHPGGACRPSPEDDEVTHKLCLAGKLLGIPVLDHVIVGESVEYSYSSQGRLPPKGYQ